uniref:CSON008648 protein n=1 Tax=Culicoides sonorensis TaxID=179676 RepID=A0A336LZ76_CULSO
MKNGGQMSNVVNEWLEFRREVCYKTLDFNLLTFYYQSLLTALHFSPYSLHRNRNFNLNNNNRKIEQSLLLFIAFSIEFTEKITFQKKLITEATQFKISISKMTSPSIKADDKLRKAQQQRNNGGGSPRRSNMSLPAKLGSDECNSKGFLSWMRVFRLSNLMVNQGC